MQFYFEMITTCNTITPFKSISWNLFLIRSTSYTPIQMYRRNFAFVYFHCLTRTQKINKYSAECYFAPALCLHTRISTTHILAKSIRLFMRYCLFVFCFRYFSNGRGNHFWWSVYIYNIITVCADFCDTILVRIHSEVLENFQFYVFAI